MIKQTFAGVFKEAWNNTVKLATVINAFCNAGIWPVDPSAICLSKLTPSTVYATVYMSSEGGSSSAIEDIEQSFSAETKKKFEERYQEGYDIVMTCIQCGLSLSH